MNSLTALIVILLGSTVIGGIVTTAMNSLRADAQARRDRYSQVVRTLVAWIEYPYRIRRRTDDQPSTLRSLADQGHELQIQMAEDQAWVAAESKAVSYILQQCVADLRIPIGSACREAWETPPIESASQMNVLRFGPRDTQLLILRLNRAISYRFGPRKLAWPSLAISRIAKHPQWIDVAATTATRQQPPADRTGIQGMSEPPV